MFVRRVVLACRTQRRRGVATGSAGRTLFAFHSALSSIVFIIACTFRRKTTWSYRGIILFGRKKVFAFFSVSVVQCPGEKGPKAFVVGADINAVATLL